MNSFLLGFLKFGNFSSINAFHEKFFKIFLIAIFFLLGFGCFVAFFTPADYLQGHVAKIMYVHVPAAWLSLFLYFVSSICIVLYFSYKNLFFALCAYSVSITGLFFNILCIVTGMFWGKFTWGVWWAWDPRLTSVFILMIFYILFIYLFHLSKSENKNDFKFAGIVNLIGMINLPIIKFSVEFYNSLHQKSSFVRQGGVSIHGGLSRPLWFFFFGFLIFSFAIIIASLKSELFQLKQKRVK